MGRKSVFPGRVVSAPTSFLNTMPPKRAIFQSARISLSGRSFPIATTTAVHNAVRLSSHGTQSPFHASTKLSIARFRRLFCFHLRSHIFHIKKPVDARTFLSSTCRALLAFPRKPLCVAVVAQCAEALGF